MRIRLLILFVFAGAIFLLKGPLKPMVPDCRDVSFGFCYDRTHQ